MSNVEDRLAKIEREIEMLKRRNELSSSKEGWITKITGTFRGDPEFVEIVRLGKKQRDSEKPPEIE